MKLDYTRYYRNFRDNSAQDFAEMICYFTERLKPHLPSAPDGAALDIGCGPGYGVKALQNMGWKAEGIDMDAGQVKAAHNYGLPVIQVEDTLAFLRQCQGKYSLIMIFDVIEHIPVNQQIDYVEAIYDALKPGGRMICTVPNASSGVGLHWLYNDFTHHSSFTKYSLDFLLYHGGFQKIDIYPDDVPMIARWPLWIPRWRLRWYYLTHFFRFIRRLELATAITWKLAKDLPLSPNLKAVAQREP